MPRPPRHLLGDGAFHVFVRGTARCLLCVDDHDYERLSGLLSKATARFGWRVHAHCLMPNHFHLVVETKLDALSRGMHWVTGIYAQRFNERHNRVGHLVQNRFGARVVEGDRALRRVCEYVVNNPVRAGLCETPEQWPWSRFGRRPL